MHSKLPFNSLTDAATIDVDFNVSHNHKVTLGGNRTLTFSNGEEGETYHLQITQDGDGNRTITWPTSVHWAGGTAPTLSTGAADIDLLRFVFNGTVYIGESVALNIAE
jgi:hypothetical protein